MSAATNPPSLTNVGNILYLSNNITKVSSNLTIGTSPNADEQFYFLGNANVTGNLSVGGNVVVIKDTFLSNVYTANANVSDILWANSVQIGGAGTGTAPGRRLTITNTDTTDTSVNGTVNGNVYNLFSYGTGRSWVWGADAVNNGYMYFGSSGGAAPEPDFEYFFKRDVGLQIQPRATGNTTDFIEALKVIGNANVVGNLVAFSNVLVPNGNVGIGTNDPRFTLDVAGRANISGSAVVGGSLFLSGGANVGGSSNVIGNLAAFSNVLVPNGNVGIGTNDPRHKLDVAGTANISGNLIVGGTASITGNINLSNLNVTTANVSGNAEIGNLNVIGLATVGGNMAVDGNTLFVDSVNNRVGIGISDPLNTLDVIGTANISGSFSATSNLFQVRSNLIKLSTSQTEMFDGNGTGVLRFVKAGGVNYIQSGLSTTGGSTAPLAFTRYSAPGTCLTLNDDRVAVGNISGTSIPNTLYVFGDAYITSTIKTDDNVFITQDGDGINFYASGSTRIYKRIGGGITCQTGILDVTNKDVGNVTGNITFRVDANNGRVGINTGTPSSAANLNVVGSANIGNVAGTFTLQLAKSMDANAIGCEIRGYDATGNTLIQAQQQGTGYRNILINPNGTGGWVGIGTFNPKYMLDVDGPANISGNLIVDTDTFFVDRLNDRVGVNTSTPVASLEVSGTAKVSNGTWDLNLASTGNSTSKGIQMYGTDSTGNSLITAFDTSNTAYRDLRIMVNRLGIRNNDPQYNLDLVGTANISSTLYAASQSVIASGSTSSGNVQIKSATGSSTVQQILNFNTHQLGRGGGILWSGPDGNVQQFLGRAYIGGSSIDGIYYNTTTTGGDVLSNGANVVKMRMLDNGNLILPSGSKLVVGTTSTNGAFDLNVSGNAAISTLGMGGNITYFNATNGPVYPVIGNLNIRSLVLPHGTFSGVIGPNFPNPECMMLMTNNSSPNIFGWGMYMGVVKDLAASNPVNSLRLDFGSTQDISTNLNNTGSNVITPRMTLRYSGNSGTLGINRTNPMYDLDVAGAANISGNLILGADLYMSDGNANVVGNVIVTGNNNYFQVVGSRAARFVSGANVIYLQTGANTTDGTSADFFIGDFNMATNTSARKFMIRANGNVGIGTALPLYPLDVVGAANVSGNLSVNTNTLFVDSVNDRVGINTAAPTSTLYVTGNAFISSNLFIGDLGLFQQPGVRLDVRNNTIIDSDVNGSLTGNVLSQISFGVRPWVFAHDSTDSATMYFGCQGAGATDPDFEYIFKRGVGLQIQPGISGNATNFNDALKVLGNGNITGNLIINSGTLFADAVNGRVGMGTTAPGQTLTVVGTGNIGNTNFQLQVGHVGTVGFKGCTIRAQDTTGNTVIQAEEQGVAYRNLLLNPLGGRIGVGKTNPGFTVDVTGNINFTGNLYQNGNIFSAGGQWTTSGSNIYYNVANGNVGIGTTTPLYKLDVAGSANVSSNIYCTNMFVINDCLVQGGDFSIMNGNLTVYERFNAFGESVLNGNLTVYNSDIYNYGNSYIYNGLYVNKNGALYTNNETAGQHAIYAYDTANVMTTLYGGADDTNKVGYFGVGGYGGGLPLLLNPNGGNVGVGTGNPQQKLVVAGNVSMTGISTNTGQAPFKIIYGLHTAAGSSGDYTVSFGYTFATAPHLTITPYRATNNNCMMWIKAITTTGATIRCENAAGTAINDAYIYWTAFGV